MVFVVHTPFILHAVLVCVFLFFSFQFCDLAEVAIIHIKNQLFFPKKKTRKIVARYALPQTASTT